MNPLISELFVLVLFVAVLVVIALWSLKAIWRTVQSIRKKRKIAPLDILGVLTGLAIAACVSYGVFIEPNDLEVTRWTIYSKKLAANPDRPSIRIVHISDLHCDSQPRLEPRLYPTIKSLHPDIIVFSGDSINCREGLPIFRKCMQELSTIAPTYVGLGNHDSRQWPNVNILGETKVKNLKGQIEKLSLHGMPICVTGVPVDRESLGTANLTKLPKDNFNIYVYHYPCAAEALSKYNIDLLCTGHTHGGQVRLPFYGAIITRSPTGKQFEAGMYHVNNTWLSVTRGVGLEGSWAPRVRFLCRPEVTVINITGDEQWRLSQADN